MRKSGPNPEMQKVRSNFPQALRRARNALGIPQEEFDQVSSRTYVSVLERGLKQPTLGKLEELAEVMNLHPLTLLALSYAPKGAADWERLAAVVTRQIGELLALEGS